MIPYTFMNTMHITTDQYHQSYLYSFDKKKLDINYVFQYLTEESYWAKRISLETVNRSIENSVCLGVYDDLGKQVGFGRMITDQATFAYLADIFIDSNHRKKGLSKKLVQLFCNLAAAYGVRRFMLATQDAHQLYAQFGFEPLPDPSIIMNKKGVTY